MKLCIAKANVFTVHRHWLAQYPDDKYAGTDKAEISLALGRLDPVIATAAEVAAIIGNKSWTHFRCEECEQEVERAVELGGEFSERHMYLCASCARAIAALACAVIP